MKTANLREYHRLYARARRFLFRLQNPAKKRGVRLGHKFTRRAKSSEPIGNYSWDRTEANENWNED